MIIDKCRDREEFKRLYDSRPMPSQYDLNWLLDNPNLFCFYDENTGVLMAYATVQKECGDLTFSGASVPKNMPNVIDAIIKVCNAFNENIYAFTRLKHARLVLKKAGFVHLEGDKYVRFKNG